MSRIPARFTEADLNRAVKVASKHSQRVLIHPDGTIEVCPITDKNEKEVEGVSKIVL